MRILLAHNSLYYPSYGGGDKSNRLLMDALADRGHEVRVVARIEKFGPQAHDQLLKGLMARAVQPHRVHDAVHLTLNGVEVHTLTRSPYWRAYFSAQLAEFDPEVIITSTDDPGQLLFDIAWRAPRARVVYLVRATIAVPFGPDSAVPSEAKTEALRHADGIVGVSNYVADYVRHWSGLEAIHVPISLMEPGGEFPNLGNFDNPYIALVNPCAVKGIDIFLALAGRMPHLQFAAVPTWGTNAEDLAALRRLPNIAVLDPVDNIDDLLRQTRILLAPSVWAEARSRIVMEAMLRGVPVMASDAGGLKEAKLGVPYLIPVETITRYEPKLDEKMVPIANVPPQDIGPWETALDLLTKDRAHWEEIAARSRAAALEYLRSLTVEPFEAFLHGLVRQPKKAVTEMASRQGAPELSEAKRRLFALRSKQRAAQRAGSHSGASIWFPTLDPAIHTKLRLFCFPHAGGGTLAYRAWAGAIEGVMVCPTLFPGREMRAATPPIDNMPALVSQITAAMQPYTDAPYAFFGHSMGAGVAFELTRSLRRAGAVLPKALIVSGARAPQYRTGLEPNPELSDEQLIAELARLGGMPCEILNNREAFELALLPLRADTLLYRNYRYLPEPPLAIPIFAYGGASDPNVRPEHLDAWREHTSASFMRREFAGGHFYLQTDRAGILEALRSDLQPGVSGDS